MADVLKQQNNYGLQGSESNDRITSLHDSILHHILSFLPTRDVVRTAILSQRWKSLWIGVSIFDISDFRCSNTSACWNSVERYLTLRNGSSIEQFKLRFKSYATSSRVQLLIASLVSHKIQHLDISLYLVEDQFTLPCSIFDCQSLRILKLSLKEITLELPDHISLPCLKVMHLRFCVFENGNSIEKLFSCCHVLEELALMDCKWIHLNSITISIPSLKRLTMGVEQYDVIVHEDYACYITIEAPALLSFNYTGVLTNHFYFTKMSSIEACIHITCYDFYLDHGRRLNLVKFFQGLENMVSLTISNETAEVLVFLAHTGFDHFPAVFQQLKYLNLSMKVKGPDLIGLLELFYLLPNLDAIEFSEGVDQTIRKAGLRWLLPNYLLTNCFSSSVKIFGLGKFHGHSYEYSFLNILLEKAVSLQRINIFPAKDINQQRLKENLEKLSTRFKRCAINIVE